MGGLLIFVSVSISVLLGGAKCLCNHCFSHISYFTCVGFADDFLSVKEEQQGLWTYKLIGQFVTAGLALSYY